MSVDDMDEFTVQYTYAYGEWQYKNGYEQGKNDAVKHGHWILKDNGNADCSICGYRSTRVYDDDNADHYCRFCGAKMDGDTNEL